MSSRDDKSGVLAAITSALLFQIYSLSGEGLIGDCAPRCYCQADQMLTDVL